MSKRTVIKLVIFFSVVLVFAGVFLLVVWLMVSGYEAKGDHSIDFESIEEMQEVLSDDFYFFDFNFNNSNVQADGQSALTNTRSLRRHKEGDFEYVGYRIVFYDKSFPPYEIYFNVIASTGMFFNHEPEDALVKSVDIDGVDCALYGETRMQFRFMLDEVYYCFQIYRSTEAEFLALCSTAIQSRYKENFGRKV